MRNIFLGAGALLLSAQMASAGDAASGIRVEQSWVRAANSGNTAAFMVISNTGPAADRLIGATSDVARMVESHVTSFDSQGVTAMRRIEAV